MKMFLWPRESQARGGAGVLSGGQWLLELTFQVAQWGARGSHETRWLRLCLWLWSDLGSVTATWASRGDAGPRLPIWELPAGTELVVLGQR